MNGVLEKLKDWNCDIAGAMERFLDDEDMYLSFLGEVSEDPALEKLKESIEAGQIKEAFEYAHTLKGVYGNMGLTPLFDKTVEIVEPLRVGEIKGMQEKCEELISKNNEFKSLL